MVAMYSIAGRQVGSHWLAMATLGTVFAVPMLMSGGKSKNTTTPPLNAGSKDEEKFIQEFMQSMEQEESKATGTVGTGTKGLDKK